MHNFGVHVMTTSNGDRALVAFGQWSPAVVVTDSELKKNRLIEGARLIAWDLADAAISDFIKATMFVKQLTQVGSSEMIAELQYRDAEQEVEAIEVGQNVNQLIRQTGSTNLAGIAPVTRWTANHPDTGHLLVGHVLMWSPLSQDMAKRIDEGVPKNDQTVDIKTEKPDKTKLHESADVDKDADY